MQLLQVDNNNQPFFTPMEFFMKRLLLLFLLVVSGTSLSHAQFSLEEYRSFLANHQNMTVSDLLKTYPAGRFAAEAPTDFDQAQYANEIKDKYQISSYERDLINKHGFMVSERLAFPTFQAAFHDVYKKDLPVYISSDAILHAFHRSYSSMLKAFEYEVLKPGVGKALEDVKSYIQANSSRYTDDKMKQAMMDADLYVSVALLLINGNIQNYADSYKPVFKANAADIDKIMQAIQAETPSSFALFAKTPRPMDWSQFTVRGHYTESPELSAYFRAMMWLGRTELYITKPQTEMPPSDEDVQRQTLLSALLCQALENSGALKAMEKADKVIGTFVGKQDNLTSWKMLAIMKELGISDAQQVTDAATAEKLQTAIAKDPEAQQNILSQILFSNGDPDMKIKPAVAYMMMGQRFIIDSYILSNVVYDNIRFNGEAVKRMMPKPLDVLFAFGNDATAQLLQDELSTYPYASNLAALRYLINSVDEATWKSSYYSEWLSAIRTLNPASESERAHLPRYMQTAAWWQKQINTQLSSWTELRHDNLLYGKQSYTGGVSCYYPGGYVEPVPALFEGIADFSRRVQAWTDDFLKDEELPTYSRLYSLKTTGFKAYDSVCTALGSIARKELSGESLSEFEQSVIDNWLFSKHVQEGCESFDTYNGWYQKILFGVSDRVDESNNGDFVIADVHTQPTDASGNMVGRVLHVATGKVHLLTVVGEHGGCNTAYIGPVASYYENISENFKRFTDEEWRKVYASEAIARPVWTNLYMASDKGENKGVSQSLLLGVHDDIPTPEYSFSISAPVPNPFSQTSIIAINLPLSLQSEQVNVGIYTVEGKLVQSLLNKPLEAGTHTLRWQGKGMNDENVANGIYLCKVTVGKVTKSVQLHLQR